MVAYSKDHRIQIGSGMMWSTPEAYRHTMSSRWSWMFRVWSTPEAYRHLMFADWRLDSAPEVWGVVDAGGVQTQRVAQEERHRVVQDAVGAEGVQKLFLHSSGVHDAAVEMGAGWAVVDLGWLRVSP